MSMKKFIALLLFSFLMVTAYSQTISRKQVNGKVFIGQVNIDTTSEGGEHYIAMTYTDDLGDYTVDSVAVGDRIWDSKCDQYEIVYIHATSPFLEVEVNGINGTADAPGQGGGFVPLYRPTEDYSYPFQVKGISATVQVCIDSYRTIKIDKDINNIKAKNDSLTTIVDNQTIILESIQPIVDTIDQASIGLYPLYTPLWKTITDVYVGAKDTSRQVKNDGVIIEILNASRVVVQRGGRLNYPGHPYEINDVLFVQPDGTVSTADTMNHLLYGYVIGPDHIDLDDKASTEYTQQTVRDNVFWNVNKEYLKNETVTNLIDGNFYKLLADKSRGQRPDLYPAVWARSTLTGDVYEVPFYDTNKSLTSNASFRMNGDTLETNKAVVASVLNPFGIINEIGKVISDLKYFNPATQTLSNIDNNISETSLNVLKDTFDVIKIDNYLTDTTTFNRRVVIPDLNIRQSIRILNKSDNAFVKFTVVPSSGVFYLPNGLPADSVFLDNNENILISKGANGLYISGLDIPNVVHIKNEKEFYTKKFYRGQTVEFNGLFYDIKSKPVASNQNIQLSVDSTFVKQVADAAPSGKLLNGGAMTTSTVEALDFTSTSVPVAPDGRSRVLRFTNNTGLPGILKDSSEIYFSGDITDLVVGQTTRFGFWYMLGDSPENNSVVLKATARNDSRVNEITSAVVDTTKRGWQYFSKDHTLKTVVSTTSYPAIQIQADPGDTVYITMGQWGNKPYDLDYRQTLDVSNIEIPGVLYAVMRIDDGKLLYDKIKFNDSVKSSGDRVQRAIDYCAGYTTCNEVTFIRDFDIDKKILQKQTVALRGNATATKTTGGDILEYEGTACTININDTSATAIQMYLQDATSTQQESGLVIEGIRFEVQDTIADVINVGHSIDNYIKDVVITASAHEMYKRGIVQQAEPTISKPLRFFATNVSVQKAAEYAFWLNGNHAVLTNCSVVGGSTTLDPVGPAKMRGIYVGGQGVTIRGGQLESMNSSVIYCDGCTNLSIEGVIMERNSLDTALATAGDPSIWIRNAASVLFYNNKITSIRPPAGAAIELDNVDNAIFFGGRYESITTTPLKADCDTKTIISIGTEIKSDSDICPDVSVLNYSKSSKRIEDININNGINYGGLNLDTTTFGQTITLADVKLTGRRWNLFPYSSFQNVSDVNSANYIVKTDSIYSPVTGDTTATVIVHIGQSATSFGWNNMIGVSQLEIGQEYNVSFYAKVLQKNSNGNVETLTLRSDVDADAINLPIIADTMWRRYDVQWIPQGDVDIDLRIRRDNAGSSFAIDGFQITPTKLPLAPITTNGTIIDDSLAEVLIRDSIYFYNGMLKVDTLKVEALLDSDGDMGSEDQEFVQTVSGTNWQDKEYSKISEFYYHNSGATAHIIKPGSEIDIDANGSESANWVYRIDTSLLKDGSTFEMYIGDANVYNVGIALVGGAAKLAFVADEGNPYDTLWFDGKYHSLKFRWDVFGGVGLMYIDERNNPFYDSDVSISIAGGTNTDIDAASEILNLTTSGTTTVLKSSAYFTTSSTGTITYNGISGRNVSFVVTCSVDATDPAEMAYGIATDGVVNSDSELLVTHGNAGTDNQVFTLMYTDNNVQNNEAFTIVGRAASGADESISQNNCIFTAKIVGR